MSTPLVECVPNFSEGRDARVIKQITDAIEGVAGVRLLGVEAGADTNRTVVTFVGPPGAVAEGAFAAIVRASQLIDMGHHRGAHPRLGATDVCPFVPVEGITMEECAVIARQVGARVGAELGIPVFLYEAAAARPERKNLADIRRGEYEGLARKLADPAWLPDFGPAVAHPRAGAVVIGARPFLIAYNVNLASTDKNHAADIAFALREKGRVARSGNTRPFYFRGRKLYYREGAFPCGSCDLVAPTFEAVRAHVAAEHGYDLEALLRANDLAPPDVVGQQVYRPGRFRACKAIGWYVDDYQRAQVSINLTDYRITPPQAVFDEARRLAEERGLVVTGSEIVGLVPYPALLEAGRHYLRRQGRTVGQPQGDVLKTAVLALGLGDVAPFVVADKVLGLPTLPEKALVRRPVHDFVDEVSRDSPAPGGGSVAALAGALGAALASMVANLTYGKEGTEARDGELGAIAEAAQELKEQLVAAVDADASAFQGYLDALRLPRSTPEEKERRRERMQAGLKEAVAVPWAVAQACLGAMRLARRVAEIGLVASLSDGAVGVQVAYAGVRGALYNVQINLKDLTDQEYVVERRAQAAALLAEAQALRDETDRFVEGQLGAGAG